MIPGPLMRRPHRLGRFGAQGAPEPGRGRTIQGVYVMKVLLSAALLVGLAAGLAWADGKGLKDGAAQSKNRGYSGMARLTNEPSATRYLVVHDRKDMASHDAYAWVGILEWKLGKGTSWKPLRLTVPKGADRPNDLEACCRVPGPGHRFLLAESGYYQAGKAKPKYGRVILVSLEPDEAEPSGWRVQWERSFRPFPPPKDLKDKALHVEGIGCVSLGSGRHALVLCTMGSPKTSGVLTWGTLDFDSAKSFETCGSAVLTPGSGPLGERSCSALFLKSAPDGSRHHVWSAAALDLGDRRPPVPSADAGPFRSIVYWAGTLVRVRGSARFRYCVRRIPQHLWTLDGVKVEAMASPPAGIGWGGLAFSTDDEDHGGIWRVLPSRRVGPPK